MNKALKLWQALTHLLVVYPAASAALVNIGVVCAGYFGLHITGDDLVYLVGVVAAVLGAFVHQSVTPLAKK